MTDALPDLHVSSQDKVTVVTFGPEFTNVDEKHIHPLREVLLELSNSTDCAGLVLDMTQVKFFGSSFIEILFRISNRMKSRGGKVALAGLYKYCAEVLRLTHLSTFWPAFPTVDEAVAAVTQE